MNNKTLMKRIVEIYTQHSYGETANRIAVEVSIIREAFHVKCSEIERCIQKLENVIGYEREMVLSQDQVKQIFRERYLDCCMFWKRLNDADRLKESIDRITYFIGGVRFFDEKLADELANYFKTLQLV